MEQPIKQFEKFTNEVQQNHENDPNEKVDVKILSHEIYKNFPQFYLFTGELYKRYKSIKDENNTLVEKNKKLEGENIELDTCNKKLVSDLQKVFANNGSLKLVAETKYNNLMKLMKAEKKEYQKTINKDKKEYEKLQEYAIECKRHLAKILRQNRNLQYHKKDLLQILEELGIKLSKEENASHEIQKLKDCKEESIKLEERVKELTQKFQHEVANSKNQLENIKELVNRVSVLESQKLEAEEKAKLTSQLQDEKNEQLEEEVFKLKSNIIVLKKEKEASDMARKILLQQKEKETEEMKNIITKNEEKLTYLKNMIRENEEEKEASNKLRARLQEKVVELEEKAKKRTINHALAINNNALLESNRALLSSNRVLNQILQEQKSISEEKENMRNAANLQLYKRDDAELVESLLLLKNSVVDEDSLEEEEDQGNDDNKEYHDEDEEEDDEEEDDDDEEYHDDNEDEEEDDEVQPKKIRKLSYGQVLARRGGQPRRPYPRRKRSLPNRFADQDHGKQLGNDIVKRVKVSERILYTED